MPEAAGHGGMNSGLYWLRVDLVRPARLVLRGSDRHRLPTGAYLYTGSARRYLVQRVARHLRRDKPLRWHVDRLTAHRAARPLGAVLLRADDPSFLSECDLNALAGSLGGSWTPIPGFGAGDCRAGCPAHLWGLQHALSLEALAAILSERIPPEAPPPRLYLRNGAAPRPAPLDRNGEPC